MLVHNDLIKLRDELCELRAQAVSAKASVEYIKTQYKEFESERVASALAKGADTDLRAKALELYLQTDDKKLIDGITIKHNTRVAYDPVEAYQWALDHLITMVLGLHARHTDIAAMVNELYKSAMFITLDTSAFEAAVKGGQGGLPATVEIVPTVNIATDLSKYKEVTL